MMGFPFLAAPPAFIAAPRAGKTASYSSAALALLVGFAAALAPTFSRAEDLPEAVFFRGFNLNGGPVEIDGNRWQGGDAASVKTDAKAFENQSVRLVPATDRQRAQMIRSSRWGADCDVTLSDIPPGQYQIVAYVWEDNQRTEFRVMLNNVQMIERLSSGGAGKWQKLGPWTVTIAQGNHNGTIKLSARGGDANFSGIELWQGRGPIPAPPPVDFNLKPSAEQLAFFESKIRPLLVDRCYDCHSADSGEVGGGLLLDSFAGIVAGGDSGPAVIPSDPEGSLLIRAVRNIDPHLQMPPDDPLDDHEVRDLLAWISDGAADPRTEDTVTAMRQRREEMLREAADFWSLRPLVDPPLPAVETPNAPALASWPTSAVDHFVLARMLSEGLTPSPPARRAALIRRATYDLIGLPPTPEEIDAFISDDSPDAFKRAVDRLLGSPLYGQRWGRHWLDVVRYADTAGDNSDFPIPQMVRYRDWVIDAINRDLPYDQFIAHQLAGDLIATADPERAIEQKIATGYIAGSRRFGSRVEDYPQHLTIEDTIDNLGRSFLAMTINCARCHDHKFDPITAEDYYALYGIFHSTRYPWPGIELDQQQRHLVPLADAETVRKATAEREAQQNRLDQRVKDLEEQRKGEKPDSDAHKQLSKEIEEAKREAGKLRKSPPPYEQLYAVADSDTIEDVHVQIKGDPAKPGALVRRRFLSVLGGQRATAGSQSSGRLELANWITDPANPLTARVMVNRVWLGHFGRGIVATANDFGRQGTRPTHPELLDHLASAFIRSGYSLKAMHRLIMLSSTYQQSSDRSEQSLAVDPPNHFLSAFPKRRLEAEAIRDTLLAIGDSLNLSPGGPHPFPHQSEWGFTQHNPFKAVYEHNHRSVYLMTQRIQRHPFLAIFDGADPATSTPARLTSTTPLQSLYFLNDPQVHRQAERFANRVAKQSDDDAERLRFAFRHAIGRYPEEHEVKASLQFLEGVRGKYASPTDESLASATADPAWQALVRVIFRLNEFIYVE